MPEGTSTVGAVPAVPAGERSAAGMGAMAGAGAGAVVEVPPGGTVVVVADGPLPVLYEVLATLDEFDGEELQAARPRAPAAPSATGERPGAEVGDDMGRDGSRSLRPPQAHPPAYADPAVPRPGPRPRSPHRVRRYECQAERRGDSVGVSADTRWATPAAAGTGRLLRAQPLRQAQTRSTRARMARVRVLRPALVAIREPVAPPLHGQQPRRGSVASCGADRMQAKTHSTTTEARGQVAVGERRRRSAERGGRHGEGRRGACGARRVAVRRPWVT